MGRRSAANFAFNRAHRPGRSARRRAYRKRRTIDDVRNGKQLWGEQYNRKLADLLSVQNDIAIEVYQRLRSQLSEADRQKLTKGSTDNPEAYQVYLKGKYYTNKFTRDGFRKGIDYFNQAIALDRNYGLAYNGLAYNYINQDDWFIRPGEATPKAKDAAKKALSIDESDADAHLSLAIVAHWYEWDWAARGTRVQTSH
jgi:tetratricopeptide (TPR) repeat protein